MTRGRVNNNERCACIYLYGQNVVFGGHFGHDSAVLHAVLSAKLLTARCVSAAADDVRRNGVRRGAFVCASLVSTTTTARRSFRVLAALDVRVCVCVRARAQRGKKKSNKKKADVCGWPARRRSQQLTRRSIVRSRNGFVRGTPAAAVAATVVVCLREDDTSVRALGFVTNNNAAAAATVDDRPRRPATSAHDGGRPCPRDGATAVPRGRTGPGGASRRRLLVVRDS